MNIHYNWAVSESIHQAFLKGTFHGPLWVPGVLNLGFRGPFKENVGDIQGLVIGDIGVSYGGIYRASLWGDLQGLGLRG